MGDFIQKGPEDSLEVPQRPIGKLFLDTFGSLDKNKIAVIDNSGESLTYDQLYQRSKNLGANLRILGVGKKDTIALVAENSKEFLIAYLAAFFLGAPLHLINPKYTKYEIKHILATSEPVVVLGTKKTHDAVTDIVKELNFVKKVICMDDTFPKNVSSFQVEENVDFESHVGLICNTSGTTGLPKSAMLTHEMIRLTIIFGRDPKFGNIMGKDVVPLVIPFFHIYGLSMVNAALYSGATIIAIDGFKPDKFLEMVEKSKPRQLYIVPTIVDFLAKSPLVEKYDLSSVKQVHSGGSSVLKETLDLFLRRFKTVKFSVGYGMTESGIILHGPCPQSGCTGTVTCGYAMKVVDLQNGRSLPPLQDGELCVRGVVMKGYLKNPEETAKIIDSQGFLHTGDVGHYDETGTFFITGRIKEIIKYKSFLVSPVELEDVLMKHKGVKDAAVVGKPDARFGEVPTAFVVKQDGAKVTEKEICDFVAEFVGVDKRLQGGVRFVDVIPKNSMGKIVRHQLVAQLK